MGISPEVDLEERRRINGGIQARVGLSKGADQIKGEGEICCQEIKSRGAG